MQTKHEILSAALKHRDSELLSYQINIDNYRLAIAKIAERHPGDPVMAEFSEDLQRRLYAETIEQQKSQVIRDVIADQLSEIQP